MFYVGKSAWPSLWLLFEGLFFFFLKWLRHSVSMWPGFATRIETTNLAAKSKPLHLAISSKSSHQTANKIFSPRHPHPPLRFLFCVLGRAGERTHATSAPDVHAHLREKYSLPGLQRQEVLRDWNTLRVITERSGAILSLFSHQHVQLSVRSIQNKAGRFMHWEWIMFDQRVD